MMWLLLLSGILVAILGITMLFAPLESLVTLAIFIGFSMLISGASEIASYCGEEQGGRSGWLLTSGILTVVFAIWTLFGRGTEALVVSLPFVFAIWVLTSGIVRIGGAISSKSDGSNLWGWMLAFGVSGAALGFLLMFTPVLSGIMIAYMLGFMLISYGVDSIIIFFSLRKFGHHIRGLFGK